MMYSKRPSFVIGFHGCDLGVRDMIVMEQLTMKRSENDYDWLGHGFYFWEGDDLYPGAGMKEKNHIQICIRNIDCVKGFFIPRRLSA